MKIIKAKYEQDHKRYVLLKVLTFPRKRNLLIGYVYNVGAHLVFVDSDTKMPTNVFPNESWLREHLLEQYKSKLEMI